MTRMYKLPVIFIFTLLLTFGNNEKLSELLSSQSVAGHHSMQYLKYSFLPFNNDVNKVPMTNSVQMGQSIALSVGWTRTVTTVENSLGQVIEQLIDYEFSLQSAIDLHSIGEFGVDVYKYKDKIVKEKVFMFCDPGPCYDHKIAVIRVNSKRYTIDIQPSLETIRELLAQYRSMAPDVQAILNKIFNPELLQNQLSLANTVITLVNQHLAIDNENVIVNDILPLKNYYEDLVKYIDSNNNVHCFLKQGMQLKPTLCPADISSIPNINFDADTIVPVKYIDAQGNEYCFDGSSVVCPDDTLLLPTVAINNYMNDNGVQYCSYTMGQQVRQFICPPGFSNQIDNSAVVTDSSYEYVPQVETTMLVKYVDENGRVHCFDLGYEEIKERSCPLDMSLVPEVNMVKYVDNNGLEYCGFNINGIVTHFACPSSLSKAPLSPIQNVQNAIAKYVDPLGKVHCYDHNDYEFSETVCPRDTNNLPIFNPYQNFFKYVDANGIPHCFYKSGNVALLEPIKCPADLSKVQDLRLEDGHVIPIKHIGPDGRIHCFDMSAFGTTERRCPADTSLFPVKNIVKFVDEDGVEHCYLKLGNKNKHIHCPRGQNNLLLSPASELSDIEVMNVDEYGRVHCYKKTVMSFDENICPKDISHLPVMNPNNDYAKYVDDYDNTDSLNINNKMFVKYTDSNGRVHCFDISDEYLTEEKCPLDLSSVPEVDIVKYVDDQGSEYCHFGMNGIVTHFSCPKSLSMVPLSQNQQLNNVITKYIDPLGRLHCYDNNNYEFTETVCPRDTSNVPVFNPYKNFYKYVDANGEIHCFYKSQNVALLEPTNCPSDLSNVEDLRLEDGHVIPIKHIGPDGRIHCFDMSALGTTEKRCPADTSLYPVKNIVKFVDEDGVEHCYLRLGQRNKHMHCPRGQNNLLLSSIDELSDVVFKNIDANGRVHCYKKTVMNVADTLCPKDTSHLPVLNPYKNYVRYVDNNSDYCFKQNNNNLKALQCPSDPSVIPISSLTTHNKIPVKYVDPNGRVHCFDMSYEDIKERKCPLDYSLLPEIDIVKYVDDHGSQYCRFSLKTAVTHFICPISLSTVPMSPIQELQNVMTKYIDPLGRQHCYDNNNNEFTETVCPRDTSNVPVFNPYKNFYKYLDANGRPHCFYKTEHVVLLEPIICPRDLSKVADLNLEDGHVIPIKHIGPDGRIHCFDMSILGTTERRCPADTSLYPVNNIVKFVDEDGVEHCYMKLGHRNMHIHCPSGQNNLLLSSVDNLSDIVVKQVDANGGVHCYKKIVMNFDHTFCPKDTSHLPVLNPYKDYVKYVGDKGEYCFKEHGIDLQALQCPIDTSTIPTRAFNTNNKIPVKYVDPSGRVHCFDMSLKDIKERKCPLDYALLPDVDIVKYLDDNNSEFCTFRIKDVVTHFACANSLPMVPLSSIKNIQNTITKYVDPQGRVHCYDHNDIEFSETVCTRDTSNLPVFNPYKYFYKYVDANGIPHCFHKSGNVALLEPINCPDDLSKVADLLLEDGHIIPIKYVGPDGKIHCFDMSIVAVTERRCPADTSLLPVKSMVKFVDDDGVEHCYLKLNNRNKHIHCPKEQTNLLLSPIDEVSDIVVKHTDDQGREHCYKKTMMKFDETVCPIDISSLPDVNPFKKHVIPKLPINVVLNNGPLNNMLPVSIPTSYLPSNGLPSSLLPSSGYPSSYLPSNILPGSRYPSSYLPSNGYPYPSSGLPSNGYPYPSSGLPSNRYPSNVLPSSLYPIARKPTIGILKDLNGNVFCYDTSGITIVNVICPADVSSLPPLQINGGKYILSASEDYENDLQCYKVYENYMEITDCPRDTSKLPHVLPLNEYNGEILDNDKLYQKPEHNYGSYPSSALADILFKLNKGSHLSPNSSEKVSLTFDELSLISKLMCKSH